MMIINSLANEFQLHFNNSVHIKRLGFAEASVHDVICMLMPDALGLAGMSRSGVQSHFKRQLQSTYKIDNFVISFLVHPFLNSHDINGVELVTAQFRDSDN